MKNILSVCFFLFPLICFSQFINCKVLDAETKLPLYFATIYYGKQPTITFSDSAGNFFVRQEVLKEKDSVKIEFIGYKTLIFSIYEIAEGKTFYLLKSNNNLQEVVIKNCKEYVAKVVDYGYKKMDSYWTVSPDFKGEFIAYYPNPNNLTGYIDEIELKTISFSLIPQNFSIPLRLHWYAWNSEKNIPGRELTDTSILVFAYKHGRNRIKIPANKIYFDAGGIVIGLEFLFPSEIEKKYLQIQGKEEQQKFMNKNTWSYGMIEAKTEFASIFMKSHITNTIHAMNTFHTNAEQKMPSHNPLILKPALNFTIRACAQ